jgi:beta-glucanase (GH16 family)
MPKSVVLRSGVLTRSRLSKSIAAAVILGMFAASAAGLHSQTGSRVPAQSHDGLVLPWHCLTPTVTAASRFGHAIVDDSCGVMGPSPFAIARRITAIVLPAAPDALTAVVSGRGATLTWSAHGGDAAYLLEVASAERRANPVSAEISPTRAEVTITGIPPGQYFVRIRAKNATGPGGASNEILIAIPADCVGVPSAPSSLTGNVVGDAVTLFWQGGTSGCPASAYVIEAGSGPGSSDLANFSTGSSATTFAVTGVIGGTYYVRVRAMTSAGTSAPSNEVRLVVVSAGACSGAPGPPAGLGANVVGTTVGLTWGAASGSATSYVLSAGFSPGGANVVVTDTATAATSLTAFGVAAGTYYVRVQARNGCGLGAASNEVVVVVNGALAPSGWTLTWSDECDGGAGSSVDTGRWMLDVGTGYPGGPLNWGTGEVESMTNSTANVYIDGSGHCVIKPLHAGAAATQGWTSGRLETQMSFEAPSNGALAVEASIRQPDVSGAAAAGYWPAFWMIGAPYRGNYLNWPAIGEIDIMEDVNGSGSLFVTLHCGTNPGGVCHEPTGLSSGRQPCVGCQSGYHTYRVELDKGVSPQQLRWYLDGVSVFSINATQVDAATWANATNHGFFVILNVAMGGGFPDAFGGGPTESTVSGIPMLVDYVRVYRRAN